MSRGCSCPEYHRIPRQVDGLNHIPPLRSSGQWSLVLASDRGNEIQNSPVTSIHGPQQRGRRSVYRIFGILFLPSGPRKNLALGCCPCGPSSAHESGICPGVYARHQTWLNWFEQMGNEADGEGIGLIRYVYREGGGGGNCGAALEKHQQTRAAK